MLIAIFLKSILYKHYEVKTKHRNQGDEILLSAYYESRIGYALYVYVYISHYQRHNSTW